VHTAPLPVGKHGKQGEGFGGIVEGVRCSGCFCGARRMESRPASASHPRRRCRGKMPRPNLPHSLSGTGARENGLPILWQTHQPAKHPSRKSLFGLIPISLGNATFGGFIVGRASRLPSNDLRSQARRPRYIQKSKSKLLLVLQQNNAIGISSDQHF
jgi:hypothetical protein